MPEEGSIDNEPIAAPKDAPLELKLKIILRNWSYPEFREVLYREAREDSDHKEANIYKRLYAYLRALELCQQGLSYNRVRGVIASEVGYRPSRRSLSCWLRGVHAPLGGMLVFDVRRPEVGLVIGLILSDGTKRRRRYHGKLNSASQTFYNTDEGLIEEFKEACCKLGLATYERLCPACQGLEAKSVLLYLLLKRFDEFVIKAPANLQLAFLRGLWLGDGHMGTRIELINTDLRIVSTASTLLKMHRVQHTIQGPYPQHGLGKKPMYRVYIRSCSRGKFLKLTGLADNPPRLTSP
ncbi:hypothetical protein B6U99_07400 [Candidatus Geothermarchaeota archaeon ex4572_27]|nr:MAG: hypothetical protein B6U99_07400 [Candidatus Geothermarchaeota archaeon ex4572_27]